MEELNILLTNEGINKVEKIFSNLFVNPHLKFIFIIKLYFNRLYII